MNRDEAKSILLLYRPGTADANDPDIIEALALAKQDPELARWLEEHRACQESLRAKFRQIKAPEGLMEQIFSEQLVLSKKTARREKLTTLVATAAIILALITLVPFWIPRRPAANDTTLTAYENQMVSLALRGYGMDITTNDPAQIRAYLAQRQAPADYALRAGLQKATLTGCAVEGWQTNKVSMICYRTGRPLPPSQQSDLWLFVVDRNSVRNPPPAGPPKIAAVNQLITAVWIEGDKIYFLGTTGDEQTIRQYL